MPPVSTADQERQVRRALEQSDSYYNLFAAMVSKKAGSWATKTMEVVHETWEVRRNALKVTEDLKN